MASSRSEKTVLSAEGSVDRQRDAAELRHIAMIDLNRKALQEELLDLFAKYDVNVGVGLTQTGIAIRSQDSRVDALNLGTLSPFPK